MATQILSEEQKEKKRARERARYHEKQKNDEKYMDDRRARARQHRKDNPEQKKEADKAYYQATKEERKRVAREWYIKTRKENPAHVMMIRLRARCKKEEILCTISEEDIIIPEFCPILGIKLEWGGNKMTSPSIDKLIPELGYVKGNISIISHKANMIKSIGTIEEHLAIAKWMQDQYNKNSELELE